MPAPLSPATVAVVKACVPALRTHGLAVTQAMYGRLFQNREIADLFNQSHQSDGAQQRALAGAILAYAENIENLGALTGAVERIAQRHAGLNILPEHYPYVATALLGALKDVLGEAATEEVLTAWGEAYWFLAEILIGREGEIYREHAGGRGGWMGWRDFRVERVERESAVVASFYLRPVDGGPVLRHKPGQFLTFRLDLPGHGQVKRNYSISSGPSDQFYRISVKREPAPADQPQAPAGLASNWLHDHAVPGAVLSVAPPAGEFVLEQDAAAPVVLVSGGVGLTPMVSMMEAVAEAAAPARLYWVHGALNGRVHAMGRHVRELAARAGVKPTCFYEAPEAADLKGRDYDEPGRIGVDWLKANTPFESAVFYLCGPRPFLRALVGGLRAAGVPAERIRFEFFGPTDELLAA
jgi:nitric oxide dioxygenase